MSRLVKICLRCPVLRYLVSATIAEKPLFHKGQDSFPSWTSPVRPRSPALDRLRAELFDEARYPRRPGRPARASLSTSARSVASHGARSSSVSGISARIFATLEVVGAVELPTE